MAENNLNQLFLNLEDPFKQKLPIITKGSVITFNYVGQTKHRVHDPYPLVIVSDIFTTLVRGVNLHYATLPFVKNMILTYGSNPNFSYSFIKGNNYISAAFRSYKRSGISQLKMLDMNFLKGLLKVVRALEPGEIDKMRQQIKAMMEQQIRQPVAQPGPPEIR